ncbi:MAG: prolyl-tRNA synthetase associated domain-containing protein [Clostridia bacterium]|nr:prolyl-tRNA synthetase associated domain-containing protein [Clostridia bacterium]
MNTKEIILARLDALGVPYERYDHPAATLEDCRRLPFAVPEVTMCKNILLCNRQQTAFYLYLTLPDKPFRTSAVSHALGSSRLSFAPESCLETMLHLHSGSLSPLGLWFDEARAITFAADAEITRTPRIAFHPCDNTCTVVFAQADFWEKIVPAMGTEPMLIEV